MVLLGEVREVEVHRERARHLLGARGREGGDEGFGVLEGGALALVRGDRERPEAFDVVEEGGTAGLGEHRAEEAAEQAHLGAQLVVDAVADGLAGAGVVVGCGGL